MRLYVTMLFTAVCLSACVRPQQGMPAQVAPVSLDPPPLNEASSPVFSERMLQGEVTLFGRPFADAAVTLYALPELPPSAPLARTDGQGRFRVPLAAVSASDRLLLVLVEKDGAQLSGVVSPSGLQIQADQGSVITLAGTLVTRLLLPRLLETAQSQSATLASRERLFQLAKRLHDVNAAVDLTLAQPVTDVRLQATLQAARVGATVGLIRKLGEQVITMTPAWQAYARWLEDCHKAIIVNVQEGGGAFKLEPWVVGGIQVESPQIGFLGEGQGVVHYQGQSHRFALGPTAQAAGAEVGPRLVRLDQLLGNPLSVSLGSGGGGASTPDATAMALTVIDGNVPAPVWEEP